MTRRLLVACISIIVLGLAAYLGRAAYLSWRVNSWIDRLDDSSLLVRRRAVGELTRLGPEAEAAAPALVQQLMLRHDDVPSHYSETEHLGIAEALVAIGPAAVPPLLSALRDQDCQDRCWGITPPPAFRSTPYLFDALREMAHWDDPTAKDVQVALNELLNHDSRDVRLWAYEALINHQPEPGKGIAAPRSKSPPDIQRWIKNLSHEDKLIRAWAARTLGDNAWALTLENWEELLPVYADAIASESEEVRYQCVDSLRSLAFQFRKEARPIVPALVREIQRDFEADPRGIIWYLFQCLQNIGPQATAAIPALSEIVKNPKLSEQIRGHAAGTLGAIGHVDGIATLLFALEDDSEDVWREAANALGRIGPEAKSAVPQLIKRWHAEDVSESARQDVIAALEIIDPEAAARAEVEKTAHPGS